MGLIKSPMGRRQFLVAAGVPSTVALAGKKLANVTDPAFQTGIAGLMTSFICYMIGLSFCMILNCVLRDV
jgi:hypothetical protein